jgi:hypothetical protein
VGAARGRLCRRPCLAGVGTAGTAGTAGFILMPPPEELGRRRLPPFAVHGAAEPSPAVALRLPVPVPELVPLLRAPVGCRYSLACGSDDARRPGQSTVCCVTVLFFLSSRLQRGVRRASAAWVLKREGGARRLLARWVWCLYQVPTKRSWIKGLGPSAVSMRAAAGSWKLEAGRCRAVSLAAALVHGRGRGRGAASTLLDPHVHCVCVGGRKYLSYARWDGRGCDVM